MFKISHYHYSAASSYAFDIIHSRWHVSFTGITDSMLHLGFKFYVCVYIQPNRCYKNWILYEHFQAMGKERQTDIFPCDWKGECGFFCQRLNTAAISYCTQQWRCNSISRYGVAKLNPSLPIFFTWSYAKPLFYEPLAKLK